MLLNIDKPRNSATLHSEDCKTLPKPVGTELKPVGRVVKQGGWFLGISEDDARSLAQRERPRGEFIRCQRC